MGRELFDFAFREYARRWRFKRPTPTDFFRTMEDASAMDLDWFWRGWFYSTAHVDVAIEAVREYRISSQDPDIEMAEKRRLSAELQREPIEQVRNREEQRETRVQRMPELRDFYNENHQFTPSNKQRNEYESFLEGLEPWEKSTLERAVSAGEYIYFVDFHNVGGLLTPLPLRLGFEDSTSEQMMVPAEIWRRDARTVTKLLVLPKKLRSIEFDPRHQTADVDRSNNHYPQKMLPSRLELFKRDNKQRDLMKEMFTRLKSKGSSGEGADVPLEPVD